MTAKENSHTAFSRRRIRNNQNFLHLGRYLVLIVPEVVPTLPFRQNNAQCEALIAGIIISLRGENRLS